MRFREFRRECVTSLKKFFGDLENGKIIGHPITGIAYPSTIMIIEFADHYGVELFGAVASTSEIRVVSSSCTCVEQYLDLFYDKKLRGSSQPALKVALPRTADLSFTIGGLCVCREGTIEFAKERFPVLTSHKTFFEAPKGGGNLVEIESTGEIFDIRRCAFVNRVENAARCKNVEFCLIVEKGTDIDVLTRYLRKNMYDRHSDVSISSPLIHALDESGLDLVLSSQLQSLFLSSSVREPTIGSFLSSHPEMILKPFDAVAFCYEPLLSWIEHDGTVTDTAINPDLMIQRRDGFYDIVDLKLARIDWKKLTTGERKRRMFVRYVNDGLAQLVNYKEYFNYEGNRRLAKEKYGIVTSSPQLYLVVGHEENFHVAEISQAMRMYAGSDINIVDYDSLVRGFRGV